MLPRQAASVSRVYSVTPRTSLVYKRLARSVNPQLRTSSSNGSPTTALRRAQLAGSATLQTAHSQSAISAITRGISTKALPAPRSRILRYAYRTAATLGTFVAVAGGLVVAFFLYDASTYNEDPIAVDIPVSHLALNPRRGGPKNLPIADHFVDDDDCADNKEVKHKPKLVILGTGWGSVALLKQLNPKDYHVTVISPSNTFLFTPMLPSATVGTLELRSLVEPVRKIVRRVHGHFLKAKAEDVEFSEKLVECSAIDAQGKEQRFYVPYDKLVVGVGSVTNPHGVNGLEYCHFLKDISDARIIRNSVIKNLEMACLPTTSDEERRRLLSFVIVEVLVVG